jgi:hypothetical protein
MACGGCYLATSLRICACSTSSIAARISVSASDSFFDTGADAAARPRRSSVAAVRCLDPYLFRLFHR